MGDFVSLRAWKSPGSMGIYFSLFTPFATQVLLNTFLYNDGCYSAAATAQ